MLLKGKKVIIIGGVTGIGKSTAIIAAREGASVVTMSTAKPTDKRAVETIEECKAVGCGKYMHIQVDASDKASIFNAVGQAAELMGGVTCLVAAQGTVHAQDLLSIERDVIEKEMGVAFYGSLYASQAVYPYMKEAGSGSIILFGSAAAVDGLPLLAAYNSTKGAIVGLSRTMAVEWATDFIRVNVVQPMVKTELVEDFQASASEEELAMSIESCRPVKMASPEVQGYDRLGKTSYAGDACVYLASDMSFFISGQIINVDGAGHFGRF